MPGVARPHRPPPASLQCPLKFLPGVPPEAPAARATYHVPTRPRRTVAVRPRVLVPVPSPRKRPLWPRRRPLWRTARLLRIPLANCAVDGAVSVRHARRAERSSLLEPWAENTLHMSMNLATRLEVQTVRQSVRMASQVAASSLAMEAHVQSRDQSSKRGSPEWPPECACYCQAREQRIFMSLSFPPAEINQKWMNGNL